MTSANWINNPSSKDFVKQLLIKAGLPLELRVMLLCQQFIQLQMGTSPNVEMSAHKIVYQPKNSPDTIREIDQCVICERRVKLTNNSVLQVILYIPIECKHRDNVEIFGLPYGKLNHKKTPFPIIGLLAGSKIVNDIGNSVPECISNASLSEVCFLEIDKGTTPKRIFEENLIYKAGMALYDFIRDNNDALTGPFKEELVQEAGFFGKLGHIHPSALRNKYLISSITSNWDQMEFAEFNRLFHTSPHGYEVLSGFPVVIYFPVVCMDAPLYQVEINNDGDIIDFSPAEKLYSSLRLTWNRDLRCHLVNSSNESLITITNFTNLSSLLSSLVSWLNSVCESIEATPKSQKERTLLEACLFQHILNLDQEEAM